MTKNNLTLKDICYGQVLLVVVADKGIINNIIETIYVRFKDTYRANQHHNDQNGQAN